jgi:hypothetical protein
MDARLTTMTVGYPRRHSGRNDVAAHGAGLTNRL